MLALAGLEAGGGGGGPEKYCHFAPPSYTCRKVEVDRGPLWVASGGMLCG